MFVLIAMWQCVLWGYTFSLAGNAADEASRAATAAATAGEDPAAACQAAAEKRLPASWQGSATATCTAEGTLWRAKVHLETPILFPGAGNFPWKVDGEASAAMEGGAE
jgi:pilus assembly protein CpaE